MTNTEVYNTLKITNGLEECRFPELLEVYLKSEWYDLRSEITYFKKVCKEIELSYEHKYLNTMFICHLTFKNPILFKNLYYILKNYGEKDVMKMAFANHIRRLYDNRNVAEESIRLLSTFYNIVYGYRVECLKGRVTKKKEFKYLKYLIIDEDNIYGISVKGKKLNHNKLNTFEIYNINNSRKLGKVGKIKVVDRLSEYLFNVYLAQNHNKDFELVKSSECYQCNFSDVKDIVDINKENVLILTISGGYNFENYGFGRRL